MRFLLRVLCIASLIATEVSVIQTTVKPPIKDTPKEDKPPNKGQTKSTPVYTLYTK